MRLLLVQGEMDLTWREERGGMGFLFDCLVELLAPVLLLPLCFSGAKEKYTFSVLVALPAMIKMIEE